MHSVERLAEADEVLEIDVVAGPPALVAIRRIWGAGDRAESDAIAADSDAAGRVARMQDEAWRRQADHAFDQAGIETDSIGVRIDVGAGLFQDGLGLRMQEIDADLLKDIERSRVHRLEFVGRDDRDRRELQSRP